MCGIAGVFFTDRRRDSPRAERAVDLMVRALGHRGPDGHGMHICRSIGGSTAAPVLGHTRLSILDLSERGAQPMVSPRGPFAITFNGEIYNFGDVRRELEARGRDFLSTSDTEVILQGYEEWGERVVDRLDGMFAFAIWNGATGQLLLARDRLGIKPLYLHRSSGCVVFASEVRALLASHLVPKRLDRLALDQYLAHQTVPTPRTLVADVEQIPPGTLTVTDREGRMHGRTYWSLLGSADRQTAEGSPAERRHHIRGLLERAIERHLVSDVPVGAFLSGGIDSSAIVAIMRRLGVTAQTFNVAFPSTSFDEAPFARAVARAFATDHTEIVLEESDVCDQIPEALRGVDHPSGDGVNSYIVSRAVRAAGLKVALSGLGGDELFGGYPSFRRLGRFADYARAWRRSPPAVRRVAAAAVRSLGKASVRSVKAAALLETDGTLPQTYPVMRQLFSREQRAALLGPDRAAAAAHVDDPHAALLEAAVAEHGHLGLMSLVSFAEARTYMHDVLLRDTDQMSMRHGLEVRVPFLDHHLVQYVMGLPDADKQPGDVPKRLLIESLGDVLPAECVQRAKRGFVLPFETWMRTSLREYCEHRLGVQGLAGRGLFQPVAIAAQWQAFLAGTSRTTWSRPWALVALDAWLEATGVHI